MSEITKEQLEEFGMVKNTDVDNFIIPIEKVLGECEEGVLAIVVTQERNKAELALKTPSGETIYLGGVQNIHLLNTTERCITEWEE